MSDGETHRTTLTLPFHGERSLGVEGARGSEPGSPDFDELLLRLDAVRDFALLLEEELRPEIEAAHPDFRVSARNLAHYLALRHFDLSVLQERLVELGLSSLEDIEAHTLSGIDAVRRALALMADGAVPPEPDPAPPVDRRGGRRRLAANAAELLGPEPEGRDVRVMVTLPAEAARDADFVRELVAAGMDCARINCAHDDPSVWAGMVEHVHAASAELGRPCRIFMDLAGPKLRTGPLEPGPRVVHWRPRRDLRGRPVAPARILFHAPGGEEAEDASTCVGEPEVEPDAVLPVDAAWLARAREGDVVAFEDTRGKKRHVVLVSCRAGRCWGECWKTAYLETGTELVLLRGEARTEVARGEVGELAPAEVPLVLEIGDTLILHRDPRPGAPAVRAPDGTVIRPAHVSCTMPEVFHQVTPGQVVRFDDWKCEGVVRRVTPEEMEIEITLAPPGGAKLRADKGINFPQAQLRVPALTDKDRADLDFVVRHAHLVGLSFVNDPDDVRALQRELDARGGDDVGIVLKIETQRGYRQLPWLLLTAMRTHPVGVMIARGDLAVECGWETLAEAQEQILWLCEAAHVPVIWATQVLERLAKKGIPSRAEITDAAMAERAECVMLNKGRYLTRALLTLDGILRRMQEYQDKKLARLRTLPLAEGLEPSSDTDA